MSIAVAATKQNLADRYGTLAGFVGVATGDPGTSATPSNEATGGSPAYARKATTPSAGSGGVENYTAATVDLAAGTYTYMFMASASTGNNMIDKGAITSTTLGGQGQLIITPTFTVT